MLRDLAETEVMAVIIWLDCSQRYERPWLIEMGHACRSPASCSHVVTLHRVQACKPLMAGEQTK